MVSLAGEEEARSRLFAPPARWGYAYVQPTPPAKSPERGNPPQQEQVPAIPRARATGLWLAATATAVGAVATLTFDSALKAFSIGGGEGTATEVAIVLANLLAAAVAFWAALVWQRSSFRDRSSEDLHAFAQNPIAALVALVCFFVPYLVLSVEAILGWRRIWQERDERVPDPKEARRAAAEYQQAMDAWQERIVRFEADEARRLQDAALWHPVPLSQAARMTCVFGGTADSWRAALATLGASLLGAGNRIAIGDLSRRKTAEVLCDLCSDAGFPVSEAEFPGSADARDARRDGNRAAVGELRSSVEDGPRSSVEGELQSGAEDESRSGAEDESRSGVEDGSGVEGRSRSGGVGGRAGVSVIRVDKQADDLQRDRFADMLFQLLLGEIRQGSLQTDVLVILGADRLGRENLKSLMDHAEDKPIKVLLFFEEFRRDAVEVAGIGRGAAAFFALGNHLEAEEASRFIGAEHKWAETKRTATEGESLVRTKGSERATSASVTLGLPFALSAGMSQTRSTSQSEASGRSETHARGLQLVHRPVYEAEQLMGLPITQMIYVEAHPDGQRTAARVDCDPQIAAEPRVAEEPL